MRKLPENLLPLAMPAGVSKGQIRWQDRFGAVREMRISFTEYPYRI